MRQKINVAVIGAGWIGQIHCECYLRARPLLSDCEVCLHTVVDIAEGAVKHAHEAYGFAHYATNWRDVVENPEIDVVDICVDNQFHLDIVVAALAGRKHVLCEKPLATSAEDATCMTQLAAQSELVNMVNFNYRKVPAIAQLQKLIADGVLGKIYHVEGTFLQDFGLDAPMSWRFERARAGGGSIITMGAHVIDTMRYLVGEFEEVSAIGSTVIAKRADPHGGELRACDVDDAMSVQIKFRNGALGTILTSWVCHGRKHHHELAVYGEKGSAFFNSERLNELALFLGDSPDGLNGIRTILVGQDNPYGALFNLKTGMGIGIKESFTIQILELLESVIHGTPYQPTFHDGMCVEWITRAILKAEQTHAWVPVEQS